jgi:hypothetical protein
MHHQNAVVRLRLSISSFIRLFSLRSACQFVALVSGQPAVVPGPGIALRLDRHAPWVVELGLPLAVIGANPALARDPARLTAAGSLAAVRT